jgi:hypothetical protein
LLSQAFFGRGDIVGFAAGLNGAELGRRRGEIRPRLQDLNLR